MKMLPQILHRRHSGALRKSSALRRRGTRSWLIVQCDTLPLGDRRLDDWSTSGALPALTTLCSKVQSRAPARRLGQLRLDALPARLVVLKLVRLVPAVSTGSRALRAMFSPSKASHIRLEVALTQLNASWDAAVDGVLHVTDSCFQGDHASSSRKVLAFLRDVDSLQLFC